MITLLLSIVQLCLIGYLIYQRRFESAANILWWLCIADVVFAIIEYMR